MYTYTRFSPVCLFKVVARLDGLIFNKAERKLYLKNAYRAVLIRARQGMLIAAPEVYLKMKWEMPIRRRSERLPSAV